MDLPDKILIVGLGTTGVALTKFLHSRGKQIGIADKKTEAELAPTLKALACTSYTGHFGSHRKEDFLLYPMIVLSPGVDSELPVLKEARQKRSGSLGK